MPNGIYSWLTLTQGIAQLSARLADSKNLFWTVPECQAYIFRALQQMNCLCNTWKTDFQFVSPNLWNSLGSLPGSPRLRTATDIESYTMLELYLLEPPTGGVWTGTTQFSLSDLQNALQTRRNEMLQISAANDVLLQNIPITPNTRRTYLPDNILDVPRVRYLALEASPTATVTTGDSFIIVSDPTDIAAGQLVIGTGIAPWATVSSINGTTVNLSLPNVDPPLTISTFPVGALPLGVAIDSSGNVWVANNNAGTVTKLSNAGATLGTFTVGNDPIGVAVDSSGNVWVSNNGDGTVTKLSNAGAVLGTFTIGGAPQYIAIDSSENVWIANNSSFPDGLVTKLSNVGAVLGTFTAGNGSVGVAIDSSGNVWVTNNNLSIVDTTVTKLSNIGAVLGTFTVGNAPTGIAIDQSGNVWVANSQDGTVTKLSNIGAVLGTFTVGNGPAGIAIDQSGNVWVANAFDNTVTELSSVGVVLGTFTVGNGPVGIAIDSSGNIWVSNAGDNTVSKLSIVLPVISFYSPTTLYRDDTVALEWYESPLYQLPSGTPQTFQLTSEPPLSFDVDIPPDQPGVYEAVTSQSGLVFAPPAATLLGIPNDYAWVLEYGALADLLGRESEATDRERSAYALKRYQDGLNLLIKTPWIMLGNVDGVACSVDSIEETDRYSVGWDQNPSSFGPAIITGGIDFIASPVGHSCGVTVLGNAPLLDATNTYLQVSRDTWDSVLDLAQSLATFKCGGGDWKQALELESRAIQFCAGENSRLKSTGSFSDILLQRGSSQDRAQNRYNTNAKSGDNNG